jgi:heme A synthase
MTNDTTDIPRPVPRWLHTCAVLTAGITLFLLVLGQLVTSFRAGMADPIWPTEPWYLFVGDWQEPSRGYLIEHSHRIAGFAVGGAVAILVLGIWWTDPRRLARWLGLIALIALIAAFGQFHGALIAQRNAVEITIPTEPVITMGVALAVVLLLGLWGVAVGARGAGLQLLAVVALVAVMMQGLLGGFRVRLDALFGPELAPIHGVFGQVVFAVLVAVAVLTARPATGDLPDSTRRILRHLSLVLVVLLFVQLVWGAMVRHMPNSLNQRLHILTAFLVVFTGGWLLRAGFSNPTARLRVGKAGWVLAGLLAIQVTLGVEAWMGKFGEEARSSQTASSYMSEIEKQAAIRTTHALVGAGVLAAAVALWLRIGARARVEQGGVEPGERSVFSARSSAVTLAGQVQPGESLL